MTSAAGRCGGSVGNRAGSSGGRQIPKRAVRILLWPRSNRLQTLPGSVAEMAVGSADGSDHGAGHGVLEKPPQAAAGHGRMNLAISGWT